MIIQYFRSSSFNTHEMCPHSYFLEYNLGLPSGSNLAADKGTIVHKILETVALIKKAQQDNISSIEHNICGTISVSKYDIDTIIEQVFLYYSTHLKQHDWTDQHFKECRKWTWKALEYNDG